MSEAPRFHNTDMEYNYYSVIPHPDKPRFLMVEEAGAWTLPHFRPREHDFTAGEYIRRAVRRQLGLEVTMLLTLHRVADREVKKRVDAVYAMENHSPAWTPDESLLWVGREELSRLPLLMPEHQGVLEAWLAEAETGALPPLRAPWAKAGWFDRATAWIEEQLAQHGLALTAPVEQLRQWSISVVMRARTGQGDFYFKAVPSHFAYEPGITQLLARLFPGIVPDPIAVATFSDQAWMLLPDFGAKEFRENGPTIEKWEEVLSLLARMQIESTAHMEDLLAVGGQDRTLDNLIAQIDPLLGDAEVTSKLEPDEVEQLRALAPRLKEMCAELGSYNVPHALIHGDFHAGNIACPEKGTIIFDWTDAAVSHPFFDMGTVLAFEVPNDVPGARERMRDAYLQPWTAYEPVERLREAFRIAETLGPLHHAISYRHLTASIEPLLRWQMWDAQPRFLREVIAGRSPSLDDGR